MPSLSLLHMPATQVRRWLRLLWLCTLFSALHGALGAWVVPVWSGQAAVQICTPQGMQWVTLDDGAPGDGERPSPTEGMAQPCVWSLAHLAMVAVPPTPVVFAHAQVPLLAEGNSRQGCHGESAKRVLLMSAMRAPPRV